MKSYVINLAERPERLAHMRETFGRAGIGFERFDAVGRDGIGDYELAARLPPRRDGRPWLPFEVGCLLSHHELWKRIAASGDSFAAIFEDDILVSERLRPILDGDLPSHADLVKLETTCQITYVGRRRIPMRSGWGCFRRLVSLHEGTGAYVISRRAAARLVDSAYHFDEALDRSLFSPRMLAREGLSVYQSVPAVAIQGIFVPELQGSAAMRSDRLEDFKLAPVIPPRSSPLSVASRAVRRLWRQASGKRIIIPFDPSASITPPASA